MKDKAADESSMSCNTRSASAGCSPASDSATAAYSERRRGPLLSLRMRDKHTIRLNAGRGRQEIVVKTLILW